MKKQYYTNAPKAYDYPGCVEICADTSLELTDDCALSRFGYKEGGSYPVRRVEMDERQAREYQIPRYQSGLYVCYEVTDWNLEHADPVLCALRPVASYLEGQVDGDPEANDTEAYCLKQVRFAMSAYLQRLTEESR